MVTNCMKAMNISWTNFVLLAVLMAASTACSVGDASINYPPPPETIIEVYPNGKPLQIANLIRSITDNSAEKPYKIIVHKGTYEEIDIFTKDYVDIVGEDNESVVLICDGSATYNSPTDYSFSPNSYSNVPVYTIPSKWKHLIFHMSNSTVSNLTLKTIGGTVKYICHQDSRKNNFTARFEHCVFVNGAGSAMVGIGAHGGQFFVYDDCQFIEHCHENRNVFSFNLHNWDNATEPCGVKFNRCFFKHTGWFHVLDLGSNQKDDFFFIDCVADDPAFVFVKYVGESLSTPYSILCCVDGGNIVGIVPDNTRRDAGLNVQSENIALVPNASNAVFGNAVDLQGNIVQNANGYFAFALSGISSLYINTFKVGFGLCEAGSYAQGDIVYVNNGVFSKTENGKAAGRVKVANTLDTYGYIMIEKQ